jgi:hypothetical protein
MSTPPAWLTEIKTKLLSLPGEIEAFEAQVFSATVVRDTAAADIKRLRSVIAQTVLSETDPATNKPRFTNEAARSAESLNRERQDPSFLAALSTEKNADEVLFNAKLKLTRALNDFSAWRHLSDLFAAFLQQKAG